MNNVKQIAQLQAANRAALDMVAVYEKRFEQMSDEAYSLRMRAMEAEGRVSLSEMAKHQAEKRLDDVLRGREPQLSWWRRLWRK